MVLTDQGFATGTDAVVAAKGEAKGDFVMYFNISVGVASLLFVDAPNTAHSIARFSNIDSLADLQAAARRRRLPLRVSGQQTRRPSGRRTRFPPAPLRRSAFASMTFTASP